MLEVINAAEEIFAASALEAPSSALEAPAGALKAPAGALEAHTGALEAPVGTPADKLEAAAFAKSPFALSVSTMGTVNTDAAYLIKTASSAARLADSPPAVLGLDDGIAQILSGLPANYYPARHSKHPVFNYDNCALFQRSGTDTKK